MCVRNWMAMITRGSWSFYRSAESMVKSLRSLRTSNPLDTGLEELWSPTPPLTSSNWYFAMALGLTFLAIVFHRASDYMDTFIVKASIR